jgi:cobalt/nickel transport protein
MSLLAQQDSTVSHEGRSSHKDEAFVAFYLREEKKMKSLGKVLVVHCAFLLLATPAAAHFGMVIPSDNMVMQGKNRKLNLKISSSHPFELVGMELVKPKVFSVMANGEQQDLLAALKETKVMGQKAWETDYEVKRPGVYMFYMEPEPYWEPAEDCFIIHYTKTVVTAFGDDEGWDQEVGLKTEIVPLSKPYALYAGNVFQGIVKVDGKPVPFAEIEVEYYNAQGKAKAPTDYMVAQTIKADRNGLFTYAAPRAGWWGFAALNKADFKLKHDGEEKDVELDAVIWVKFEPWQ